MSQDRERSWPATTAWNAIQSKTGRRLPGWLLVVLALQLTLATSASAHGPVNPAGTSFLATLDHAPKGVRAIVVDGDQSMWMSVAPALHLVVLDYRGAPYLRFTRAGVAVNRNSAMYFLNQVPPELVPAGLGPNTPPHWTPVTQGHSYHWHDGRLHALAATAVAPGATYLGAWTIPMRIGGRPARLAGAVHYAPAPSLVWFWPIVVAVACVLAAMRVGRRGLDLRVARVASAVALAAVAVAGTGEQLHGRPGVSLSQYVLLAVLLGFVAWGVLRLAAGRDGWFGYFVIALAALWQGGSLVGVLTHGFVLLALPPVAARVAVAACLAAGAALLPAIFRLAELGEPRGGRRPAVAGDADWEGRGWDEEL